MKTLTSFIQENIYHLGKLIIDIQEELGKYEETAHVADRKNSIDFFKGETSQNLGGIKSGNIKEILYKADDFIVNNLLNNKFKINDSNSRYCFRKKDGNTWIMIIGYITNFNKQTLIYDTKIVTIDRFKYKPVLKDYVIAGEIINNHLKEL